MRSPLVPLCLLMLTALAPAALAGQAVLFSDGRSMQVERIVFEQDRALLTLTGGGDIAVPASRVVRWHDVEASPGGAVAGRGAPAGDSPAWRFQAGAYADAIAAAAARHDLDPALLTSMARVESAFDPRAVSPKGACGLLQLMPATADRFGVDDVFDVSQNLEGGARYLRWLLERYEGRTELALAGYNAGEGAVDRFRGIPPYAETRRYVAEVLGGVGQSAQ